MIKKVNTIKNLTQDTEDFVIVNCH